MNRPKETTNFDESTQIMHADDLKERMQLGEKIPSFIVIDGADTGRVFRLTSAVMSMGRGSNANIRLNDKTVSRKHCLVEMSPGFATVIDLQSSNGTFVNGERVSKWKLSNGDKVRIGSSILRYDITDADDSQFHERVYQLITFDDLTSLYNRKYLLNRLEFLFKIRKPQVFALLFLDIDHFKQVNDRYDHLTGSDVLSELGRLLLSNLRTADVACRYGGEEFIIILQDTTGIQAVYVAEKIRKLVEDHRFFAREGHEIRITISIGIAERTTRLESPEELVARCDAAMYKAKEWGRNRTVLYQEDKPELFSLVTPFGMEDDTSTGISL